MLKGDPKPSHADISDRQFFYSSRHLLLKEWENRSPRSNNVAIASDCKAGFMSAYDVVGCDEKFVGNEFGRSVKIDRVSGFVCGECDHFFNFVVDRSGDDVFSTVN